VLKGSSRRKMQQAIKGKTCGQAGQRFLAFGKSYEGRATQALPGHSSSPRLPASHPAFPVTLKQQGCSQCSARVTKEQGQQKKNI